MSTNERVPDVLAVFDDAERWANQLHRPAVERVREARAKLAELIAADREYDEACAARDATGRLSPSTWNALVAAGRRRAAALAACGVRS